MTDLNKPVRRRSAATFRDRSKRRRIVVTLYPAGFIGLRLERCRREETISLEGVYEAAVKSRVAHERAQKKANRNIPK